jgi:hypothetical protein
MKYIKNFENIDSNVNCYYKIIIDGSFDKFLVALEKLGIKDDFFQDWGIFCFDDIHDDFKKYFKNKSLCLVIYKTYFSTIKYIVRRNLQDFPFNIIDLVKYNYKGVITVEDYEVDANKYNL